MSSESQPQTFLSTMALFVRSPSQSSPPETSLPLPLLLTGIIYSVFTLPRLLSVTLPYLGTNKVLDILERTGLLDELDTNSGGITFLAPDNKAIPSGLSDEALAKILRRHVIFGLPVFTSDLKHGDSYKSLDGTKLVVTIECGDVFLGGVRILSGDAIIKNGVVHVVEKVGPHSYCSHLDETRH